MMREAVVMGLERGDFPTEHIQSRVVGILSGLSEKIAGIHDGRSMEMVVRMPEAEYGAYLAEAEYLGFDPDAALSMALIDQILAESNKRERREGP